MADHEPEPEQPPAPTTPDPAAMLNGKLIARPGVWARCCGDVGTCVRWDDLAK